jgi:hypothetical protein
MPEAPMPVDERPARESSQQPRAERPERAGWKLSAKERGLLATAGVVVTCAAAIVQVAGTTGEQPSRSIALAAGTLIVGAVVLIGAVRLSPALRKKLNASVLQAIAVIAAACVVGGAAGYAIARSSSAGASLTRPPRTPGGAPAATSGTASSPAATASARESAAAPSLHGEVTDNRNGTQVFGSPEGAAAAGESSIPYDTTVSVLCWAPNNSAIVSINAFYLVETSPWRDDYAPADTFANGDPVGQPGSTAIDPSVPRCR